MSAAITPIKFYVGLCRFGGCKHSCRRAWQAWPGTCKTWKLGVSFVRKAAPYRCIVCIHKTDFDLKCENRRTEVEKRRSKRSFCETGRWGRKLEALPPENIQLAPIIHFTPVQKNERNVKRCHLITASGLTENKT